MSNDDGTTSNAPTRTESGNRGGDAQEQDRTTFAAFLCTPEAKTAERWELALLADVNTPTPLTIKGYSRLLQGLRLGGPTRG